MQVFRKSMVVLLAAAALLAACAPVQPPQQVQDQIGTGVALTVQAQNEMSTAVAQTLTAQAPLPSATASPTTIPLVLPTLPPIVTVTPFVFSGGGGGGSGSKPKYSCDVLTRPFDNTKFKPGDPFDIKWTLTNTGTATWDAGWDLHYFSGPHLTSVGGVEIPQVKPGHTFSVNFDANAPLEKGDYVMTWQLQVVLCYPYVAIHVGKPGDP